jgi:hypothetical protein
MHATHGKEVRKMMNLNEQRLQEAEDARRKAFDEKCKLPGYKEGLLKLIREGIPGTAEYKAYEARQA